MESFCKGVKRLYLASTIVQFLVVLTEFNWLVTPIFFITHCFALVWVLIFTLSIKRTHFFNDYSYLRQHYFGEVNEWSWQEGQFLTGYMILKICHSKVLSLKAEDDHELARILNEHKSLLKVNIFIICYSFIQAFIQQIGW